MRADRGNLELARRAARFERQQPFILQQYKPCKHPDQSRSGVADRAACKRVVPTLHRRVLRQPSLLDVINIRLAQPGPLFRHLLIREAERDELRDGAVERPVDVRLLKPSRSQVLRDVPAVVAATASRVRCWLAGRGEQIDVQLENQRMKTCDASWHRLPVQVRPAAQARRRDMLRIGVVVLRLADAADGPAVRDDHPIKAKLPPQHLVVKRSVGAGGRADAVVQALRAHGIVPACACVRYVNMRYV